MTPAQLQILNEIDARLNKIKVANGYDFDIVTVEKARREDFTSNLVPAINYYSGVDSLVETNAMYRHSKRSMIVSIEGYKSDIGNVIDNAYAMAGAIWQSLFRATDKPLISDPISPDLGGIVVELELQSVLPLLSQGMENWYGCLVELTVIYKTESDDPFTLKV